MYNMTSEEGRRLGQELMGGITRGLNGASVAEVRRAYEAKYELGQGRDIPSDEIIDLSHHNKILAMALSLHRRGECSYTKALEQTIILMSADIKHLRKYAPRIDTGDTAI